MTQVAYWTTGLIFIFASTLVFLLGFIFFGVYFSLSMCTLCQSADERSFKRKFYKQLTAILPGKYREKFDDYIRHYGSGKSYSFLVFVVGICTGSF